MDREDWFPGNESQLVSRQTRLGDEDLRWVFYRLSPTQKRNQLILVGSATILGLIFTIVSGVYLFDKVRIPCRLTAVACVFDQGWVQVALAGLFTIPGRPLWRCDWIGLDLVSRDAQSRRAGTAAQERSATEAKRGRGGGRGRLECV